MQCNGVFKSNCCLNVNFRIVPKSLISFNKILDIEISLGRIILLREQSRGLIALYNSEVPEKIQVIYL